MIIKSNLILTILLVAASLQIIVINITLFINALLYAPIRDEYRSDDD